MAQVEAASKELKDRGMGAVKAPGRSYERCVKHHLFEKKSWNVMKMSFGIIGTIGFGKRNIIGKKHKKSSKTTSNHQTTHQKSPQNHQKQANFSQEECLQVEQRLTPLLQRTEQRIDVQEQELKLVAGAMGM